MLSFHVCFVDAFYLIFRQCLGQSFGDALDEHEAKCMLCNKDQSKGFPRAREEPKFWRFESWADPVSDLSISLFDEDGGGNIDFGFRMLQKL